MVILADTSAWIDFLNGVEVPWTVALADAARRGSIVVGDLVLAEVLQGIRSDERFLATRNALARFPCVALCDQQTAVEAAANYRSLRKRGITVRGTIDVIIATWCIRKAAMIIHNDRDLAVMERELGLVSYQG